MEPPSEADLRALLAERMAQEERQALEDARAVAAGVTCPGCAQADLQAEPRRWPPAAFQRRPALRCAGCKLGIPPAPNALGLVAGALVGLGLSLGGLQVIAAGYGSISELRRTLLFLLGSALIAVGVLGFWAWLGDRNGRPLGRYLLRRRRAGGAEPTRLQRPPLLFDLLLGLVLYLLVRHFVAEPFVIPTGSMAPTVRGEHFQLECPNCQHPFALGKARSDFNHHPLAKLEARCPLCAERFSRQLGRDAVQGGDKILVDKLSYRLAEPRRWDLMVFRFPLQPWVYYIKRVVGLPGEVLQVKNGDLYADEVLQRKPPAVQDALWLPVHDSTFPSPRGGAVWRPLDGESGWEVAADGSSIRCRPEAGGQAWLSYYPDRHGVVDSYGYNRGWRQGYESVADLRLRVAVVADSGARLRLAIQEDARVVAAVFPVGDGQASFSLEVDGRVQVQRAGQGLSPGRVQQIALAYADDRARLIVNGETLITWDDPTPPMETEHATARLGLEGAPAEFRHVAIDRDVYYVKARGVHDPGRHPVRVPLDGYFCLGDNSPNSEDGRSWGFVRRPHLVGRAIGVWWPLSAAGLVR